ncbi:MAG: DUF1365 domain-containing protein [Paracoccaceae bacterium]
MSRTLEHIAGHTYHARKGGVANAFRYKVDYLLIDPEVRHGPALFSRNRLNLASVHDRNHGGAPGKGRGVAWAREVLAAHGLEDGCEILLLTQPRFLGYIFNPVSFWMAMQGGALRAVIAEVNNTFGDRHSYICHLPGFAPIGPGDRITARKVFHVSPFQEVAGDYAFSFDITPESVMIRILLRNAGEGLIATLEGPRAPLTNRSILTAALRRPFGAFRTIALIHWQAVKLKLKGARYRTRPAPPAEDIT